MKRRPTVRSPELVDREYLAWIHTMPCAAFDLAAEVEIDCQGHRIEADHAGRKGLSQRAHDRSCIALCTLHHRNRHEYTGPFKGWSRERMRFWLNAQIAIANVMFEQREAA